MVVWKSACKFPKICYCTHSHILFWYDKCWGGPLWWCPPLHYSYRTQSVNLFIRVDLCTCAMGYDLPWYGVAPSFNLIETGGRFQSPRVPSKSVSYLSSNKSSFSLCDGCRWEQLSQTMTGRSALLYLASSIAMTLLVSLRVLTGSWAWQVLCINSMVTLGDWIAVT